MTLQYYYSCAETKREISVKKSSCSFNFSIGLLVSVSVFIQKKKIILENIVLGLSENKLRISPFALLLIKGSV